MPHRIIENEADVADLARLLGGLTLPVTVEWVQGRDRSLEQNRLQFLWAREASEQRGDMTTEEVRCEWKLHFGVPIMREVADWRADYDDTVKGLPYHHKLRLMRHYAVTSEMKVRQMVRYLDAVYMSCAENGIRLTDPDPSLASYQARYRAKAAA